ncbi:MAG: response regulator [Elusimicrobia bacterium]|nr:response regulator [Elusimicrobiota bacterium]
MPEAGPQQRILAVDDEEGIRYALKRLLSKIGYSVILAKSGEEALELMKEGPFHLLLADLKLPGLDGLEVARHFKSSFPQAGILVLTGIPSPETARQAADLGVFDYLAKPFDCGQRPHCELCFQMELFLK